METYAIHLLNGEIVECTAPSLSHAVRDLADDLKVRERCSSWLQMKPQRLRRLKSWTVWERQTNGIQKQRR